MNISERISSEKLAEILMTVYKKGEETENLKLLDMIEEIKSLVVLAVNTEE